jgi:hypothetical protein
MLVQHVSLGIGKVVAVEPNAVHVFFPDGDGRCAAKLQLPRAEALLRRDGVGPNEWLEGLSAFKLDPVTRRYTLAASWITHDQAIEEFRATYPRGFLDPAYAGTGTGKPQRASRWRAARAEWTQALGEGQAERLLADGDIREVVKRALGVERHVVLVPGIFEPGALAEAFRDLSAAGAFFQALLAVLAVPSPARARFEKLFAATAALDFEPDLAWPLATLFPFIAEPSRQVFLAPRSACGAAERLGCDLRFDAAPNWATYSALRALSEKLLAKLQPIGARDFVDVEAFLHATATVKERPAAARRRKVSPAPPPPKPARRAAKA